MQVVSDELQLPVGQLAHRTPRHEHVASRVILAPEAVPGRVEDIVRRLTSDVLLDDASGCAAAVTIATVAIVETCAGCRVRPAAEPREDFLQLLVTHFL